MPAPDKPELRTGIKFEPRRTKDRRVVLRPVFSAVTFLSSDGIVLTLHLPDIDLAQIGAVFVFPPQNGLNMRVAGDPLSSLPSRMGQILSQSATPLFLYTEYVAYVTDLPEHEGPGPEADLVAEQQAHIAMQVMASGTTAEAGVIQTGPRVGTIRSEQELMQQWRQREEADKEHQRLIASPSSGPDLTKVFDYAARLGLKPADAPTP